MVLAIAQFASVTFVWRQEGEEPLFHFAYYN